MQKDARKFNVKACIVKSSLSVLLVTFWHEIMGVVTSFENEPFYLLILTLFILLSLFIVLYSGWNQFLLARKAFSIIQQPPPGGPR
jgi:hypothetical protein